MQMVSDWMPRSMVWAVFAAVVATPACAVDQRVETEEVTAHVTTFADGLSHPWGLAFLPGGDALVTERAGRLRHVSADGDLSEPLSGVPEVDARDQGGLLDVVLDPDFADNRLVYLSFSEPGEGNTNSTAVARGVLADDNSGLTDVEVIFSQQPKVASTKHFGSRLVFDGNGHIYVAMGERSERQFRDQAQDLDSHIGKIVRLHHDGSVPEDNPFVGQEGALPEIWALGIRNIQAAAMNPNTNQLWEIEHGPRGGDELNIIEPGANYGWPLISYGVNYDGTPIGTGQSQMEGMVDPIYQWTPVIAPSGMIFHSGEGITEWEGDLFVGGLVARALVRLELDGEAVASQERILESLGKRIRDVAEGPGGDIFLLTDEDSAEILRISPAD